jgi:hypothetical protein
MVLSSVFAKFAKAHPVAVMARALMERALEPKGLDALFRRHAKRQYEKELLFSTMVDVMALVVCQLGRQVVTNRTARDRRWARGSQGSASPWDRLWASYPPR